MVEESRYERIADDVPDEESLPLGRQEPYELHHKLSQEERKRLWWRNGIINVLFITAWFIISITLSVYNKWMFSADRYGFTWPLFVTTIQFFIQFLLALSVRMVWPHVFRPRHDPTREDYSKKVVPTAVATSLDVGLSNLSMKMITLSFYTMCKSSSLIFVLAFAFIFKLEVFSWRLVAVIILITAGVLMMVATETQFVLLGFILITSASALSGLRWSLTHTLMKRKEVGMENPAAVIFWLAPPMCLSLGIISVVVENWFEILSSRFFNGIGAVASTAFFLFVPGMIAFCMVLTEYYIVQRAGVVPMSIAGIAKEVTTISVAAWLFGDELTPLNLIGLGITVCGIALFTYHKYRKSVLLAEAVDVDRLGVRDQEYEVGELSLDVELEEQERTSLDAPSVMNHASTKANVGNFPTGDTDVLFDAESHVQSQDAQLMASETSPRTAQKVSR